MAARVALVTGANKGIGLAICKALAADANIGTVVAAARDDAKGKETVKQLNDLGFKNVDYVVLDVGKHDSIPAAVQSVLDKHKKIDVLVNNAGIQPEDKWTNSVLDTKLEHIRLGFDVNTLGPLVLIQQIVPHMKTNKYGRIVNVSSGAGQLSDMNGKAVAYRFSKVSMNALTRIVSDELKNENIIINSMCPGSVKTDMNPNGPKTPEQAAETAYWLSTLADDGPRGKFFRDKKEIPW